MAFGLVGISLLHGKMSPYILPMHIAALTWDTWKNSSSKVVVLNLYGILASLTPDFSQSKMNAGHYLTTTPTRYIQAPFYFSFLLYTSW